jgi:hypothetical protein
MKLALGAFAITFAVVVSIVGAVMTAVSVSRVVAARSAIPSRLGAGIRSPEITGLSAGPVPPSRVAGAVELETRR